MAPVARKLVNDMEASDLIFRAAIRVLALDEAIRPLRDERDALRSEIYNTLLASGRKSVAIGKVEVRLDPRTTIWCKCHRVDVSQCQTVRDGVRAGATLDVDVVDLERHLSIKLRDGKEDAA